MKFSNTAIRLSVFLLIVNTCYALTANFNGDDIVNFKDFVIFANDWAKDSNLIDPNTDLDGIIYYKVTGTITPDATGDYFVAGTHNGVNYYKRTDNAYYLWRYTIGGYYFISNAYFEPSGYYWQNTTGTLLGNYPAEAAADGTAIVSAGILVGYSDLVIFAEQWLQFEDMRTLTTTASAGGTITSPGIGTYNYDVNSYANITAAASSVDYNFTNWTGSAATAGKVNDVNAISTTVLMDANYTVQANFIPFYGYPPTANEVNITAYTYITKDINLASYASDDGVPSGVRLTYIIVSTPNDVNVYLQDPASGCGKITNSLLPYTLRNHGSTVWLAADNNETFTFKYKVNDTIYDSCDANCTVIVSENLHDCLSFDGGWVTIPDNNNLDLKPNRAIGFCFNTRKPFCSLIRKHETGSAGYDVNLVSGKIVANIYDANGIVATIKSNLRYDNGQWCNVVFALNDTNDSLGLYISFGTIDTVSNWYQNSEILWSDDGRVPIAEGIYSNDCNLIIGNKGEIDAIRTYTLDYSDVFRTLSSVQTRETAGDTQTYVPVPIVQFKCNEGSGTTIINIKDPNLVGVFSDPNFVKWTPWNWFWADINVQHWRRQ